MPLQLRQICLVAAHLAPVAQDLTAILGIQRCYTDPGVGKFGLENVLMPVGRNFLEVVAPVEPDTAAERYLQRRHGDGGYMVITQADSRATQATVRQNALDNGVRIAFESLRDDWNLCQLHPGDLQAAFLEVESDAYNDFSGYWHPVGGTGWEDKVDQSVTRDIIGVELQCADPAALAALWASIIGTGVTEVNGVPSIALNNSQLHFVRATDNRGAGLSGLHIQVAKRDRILEQAQLRGCYVNHQQVDIGGVHWYLHDV